ncbi:hypothetical protein, partial [Vreelandella olivaria]|uniref:hypothetical protein n=1 Tax=Vreelandella olivaria TaxID=390919 RepID=UPI00201E96E0
HGSVFANPLTNQGFFNLMHRWQRHASPAADAYFTDSLPAWQGFFKIKKRQAPFIEQTCRKPPIRTPDQRVLC